MANETKTAQLQEELFGAIYEIVKGTIKKEVHANTTKECKIVEVFLDNKGIRTGKYKVQSQDAYFDAYAQQGDIYSLNQWVYVLVPNDDTTTNYFIVGQKVNSQDEQDVYNLKMPFDDFVGMYNLTQNNPMDEYGFWANCPEHTNLHLWHWEKSSQTNIFATKLGIELNVRTLLQAFRPTSGKFGVKVAVSGLLNTSPAVEGTREYFFLNDQMYGNPYAYTHGSTQQSIINVENFIRFDAVDIYFYQDMNFRDDEGALIPWGGLNNREEIMQEYQKVYQQIIDMELSITETEQRLSELDAWLADALSQTAEVKNIILSNLRVLFGLGAEDITEETIMLYTYDPINYGYPDISDLDRELHAVWVHKIDGELHLLDKYEELADIEAKAYWYRYDPAWAPDNPDYDAENESHRLGGIYWRPYDYSDTLSGTLSYTVEPDYINKSKERYKLVISVDGSFVQSNVLIFENNQRVEEDNANLVRNDKIILRLSTIDEESGALNANNALGNFFVYNENNIVLKNDDNIAFSDIRYFVEPWIKIEDTYQRLTDYRDENGIALTFDVQWQRPEGFSMISQTGFLDEGDKSISHWNKRSDWEFERDKNATMYFYIKPQYNIRYGNNIITAIINIAGMGEFVASKEFLFGRAEAFGCEYIPVIRIAEPRSARTPHIITNQDFRLECLVYDRSGNLIPTSDRPQCQFTWKYYGPNKPLDNQEHSSSEGFTGNCILGRISQPIPFVAEVIVNGIAEYPISAHYGALVADENLSAFYYFLPDRVEFRSDGQQPIYNTDYFEIIAPALNEEDYYLYKDWKISSNIMKLQSTLVPKKEIINADGNVESLSNDILKYKLAFINSNFPQWDDSLQEDEQFTYIYYNDGEITVAQAIAFTRNYYPSSLVNEWNGQTLSIDEANGSIIGRMIATGTKNSDNRFSGIMMGYWKDNADESLDATGLYGFSAGEQTFALRENGTGFIGPSGKGRIQFDGRNALLSNSDGNCYINLNPYTKEYRDGNSSPSQFFLYCKSPRTTAIMNEDDDQGFYDWTSNEDITWGKTFIEDEDNDYFIVDPVHGILTTGGVFARYGRIGKNFPWIIYDNGLTQKNFYGRIFLGNPEKNPSNGAGIPNPSFTDIEGNEIIVTENFFSISSANNRNIIQTGIRADGFFYTKYAAIGNWFVNESEIYSSSDKVFRKEFIDNGYLNDYININAKHNMISFDKGHMVIDGEHGWMSSSKDSSIGTSSLKNSGPDTYNMLLDFNSGIMSFNNTGTGPNTSIDGTNGRAFFSRGNIYFDGATATIWCGVDNSFAIVGPDGSTIEQNITTGTIYLAQTQIQGTSVGEDFIVSVELLNYKDSFSQNSVNNNADFESGSIISFPDIVEDSTDSFSMNQLPAITIYESSEEVPTEVSWDIGTLNKITLGYAPGGNVQSALRMYFADDNIALSPSNGVGLLHGEWNILNGRYISSKTIIGETIEGTKAIVGDKIYMNSDNGYELVATQQWVFDQAIQPLWSKTVTVNNLAATALNKANDALWKANKILQQSVTELNIDIETGSGFGFLRYEYKNAKGDSISKSVAEPSFALGLHGHAIEFGEVSSNGRVDLILTAEASSNEGETTLSMGHTHDISFSFLAGTVAATVGSANFSNDAAGRGTFDVSETTWYQTRAFGYAQLEGRGETAVVNVYSLNDTLLTRDNSVDLREVYDDGYQKGWEEAAARFSAVRTGNIITVTGPGETIKTQTTQTFTATAALGGAVINIPAPGTHTVEASAPGPYYNSASITWS